MSPPACLVPAATPWLRTRLAHSGRSANICRRKFCYANFRGRQRETKAGEGVPRNSEKQTLTWTSRVLGRGLWPCPEQGSLAATKEVAEPYGLERRDIPLLPSEERPRFSQEVWGWLFGDRKGGEAASHLKTSGCGLESSLEVGRPVSNHRPGECFEAAPFAGRPQQRHPFPTHTTPATSKPREVHPSPLPPQSNFPSGSPLPALGGHRGCSMGKPPPTQGQLRLAKPLTRDSPPRLDVGGERQ